MLNVPVWMLITFAIGHSGAASLGLAVYPWFFIGDFYSCLKAAKEARACRRRCKEISRTGGLDGRRIGSVAALAAGADHDCYGGVSVGGAALWTYARKKAPEAPTSTGTLVAQAYANSNEIQKGFESVKRIEAFEEQQLALLERIEENQRTQIEAVTFL